jgi:hypothetical protein
MFTFSQEYIQWFRSQAERATGKAADPPILIPDAFFRYSRVTDDLFMPTSHANPAGRFASLATAALMGRYVCDSAMLISLREPKWTPPPWLSVKSVEEYERTGYWDDLAAAVSGNGACVPFSRRYSQLHAASFEERTASVSLEEISARVSHELEPHFARLSESMQRGRRRLSAAAFRTLIIESIRPLVVMHHAYALRNANPLGCGLEALADELTMGLIVGMLDAGKSGVTAIVLTV